MICTGKLAGKLPASTKTKKTKNILNGTEKNKK